MATVTSRKIDADWLRRPETLAVFAAFAARGLEVRVVGGAVRNALIGKAAADVDMATPAAPADTMAAATAAGLGVIATGLAHGTVTIMSRGQPYEVTTLRRDVETDGRRAVVAYTTDWRADAARRDFTINALYCSSDGIVHDPLGTGLDDLDSRRVRFIGHAEARIREDYLRILRFFRFSAEYAAGALDADGLAACSRLRDGLTGLSAERIRAELLKLFVAPRAAETIETMFGYGYWPMLLGRVPWLQHAIWRIRQDCLAGRKPDGVERLAILAAASADDARYLGGRLRLSNDDVDAMRFGVSLAAQWSVPPSDHALRLALYRHGRPIAHMACAIAEARRCDDWTALHARVASHARPIFPIKGRDLLDRGAQPGPQLGADLQRLEQQWIDSDFAASRDDLLLAYSP